MKHFSSLKQVLEFILVGSLNALIDLLFLNILLMIWPTTDNVQLIVFNTIAYLLAITNSYFWNSRISFRKNARKDLREKVYFFIQAGISLIISNLIFLAGTQLLKPFNLSIWQIQNISKAFAMATPSFASFLFMKYFVFRRKKPLSPKLHEENSFVLSGATKLIS
jgi:putative flippase GtrA